MKQKIKFTFKKIDNIFSWVFLIGTIILAVYTFTTFNEAKKTGEEAFIFNHRLVYILTGSMEPYMMTNSIALTREVTDIAQLEVGDVVSYHVNTEEGDKLRITHRIIAIEGDEIYTKGDNNNVVDGFALSIDNIEAEVITVFNQTAWLVAKWKSSMTGKILIISGALSIILIFKLIKIRIRSFFDDEEDKDNNSNNDKELNKQIIETISESEKDQTEETIK